MNSLEKFDNIKEFLAVYSGEIDIVVIGETWVKDDRRQLYSIDGYKSTFSCRPESLGGGLAVFVRQSLIYDEILNEHICGFHHIHLRLAMNGSHFDVHAMYRPPSFDVAQYLSTLETVLSDARSGSSCIVVGDVNLPVNQPNNRAVEEYLSALRCYNFKVTNTFPTRPISSNILDHVVCSESLLNNVVNETIFSDISDHCFVLSTFQNPKIVNKRVLEKTIVNHAKLHEDFVDATRSLPTGSAEAKLQYIINLYQELKENCSRKITVQAKIKGSCPWMTFDLWKMIQIKDKILSRSRRHPLDTSLQEQLAHVSKMLQRTKEQAKRSYYSNLLRDPHPKNMWKILDQVLGRTFDEQQQIELEHCGRSVKDPKDVAEIFNEFFSGIGPQLASSITSRRDITKFGSLRPTRNSFFMRPTTKQEVIVEIKELDSSKSCGPDGIPATFLKTHYDFFAELLTDVFNEIIDTGLYPDFLKIARVIPIHKSGSKKDPNNYRPISVLSVFNKVLERLIVRRLTKFLEVTDALYHYQYGFRVGSNTLTATSELVDDIYDAMDKRKVVGVLFLDLKKAFDTIDHAVMLQKLDNYGIRGTANRLIQSYLSGRKQSVSVQKTTSAYRHMSVGVPQGSNLGPLLFLLYINDLPNLRLHGKPRLFADDTSISYIGTDANQIVDLMKQDLEKLEDFFSENLLSLNLAKTKYIIFHSPRLTVSRSHELVVNSTKIDEVDSFKYLGLTLDSTLSWSNHINTLQKAITTTCGVLWKVSKFLPSNQLLLLYHAFVQSRICYLVSIWGAASKTKLKTIQTTQNRCLKVIYKKPWLYPTVDLYTEAAFSILPVAALRDLQTLVQIQNLLHNPSALHNQSFPRTSHRYETRNPPALIISRPNTEYGKMSYSYYGRTKYNTLPISLRSERNPQRYKHHVTLWIKNHIANYII